MTTAALDEPKPARRERRLDGLYVFFALNYLAQGLGGFVYEPIDYLLKDKLGLSAAGSARFVFWMTLPFLVKPVFGLLTDLISVRGWRRRPHLVLVSGISTAAWLWLAARRDYGYAPLLALLVLANVGLVGADVVCDAVMVEQGKLTGRTGVFQAVQLFTLYASLVVTGLGGGWLAAHVSYRRLFALAGAVQGLTLLSALFARERRIERPFGGGIGALSKLLAGPRFWALSAVIFLWSFQPFLGSAQFYYQSGYLRLDPVFIGLAATLNGAAGALGAAFYGRAVGRRWSTGQLARAAVVLGVPLSLLYCFYLGRWSVAFVETVSGFGGVALRLALMDLAAQACPEHAEATAFAAFMAVFSLAASASNVAGGALYDRLCALGGLGPHGAACALAGLAAATTLGCWPLLGWAAPERAPVSP